MIAYMSGGQPSRRFRADMGAKKAKIQMEKTLLKERFKDSACNFKTHMKTELSRYRRSLQKNMQVQRTQVIKVPTEAEKKAERIKRKEEIEEERRNKKARLDLLF